MCFGYVFEFSGVSRGLDAVVVEVRPVQHAVHREEGPLLPRPQGDELPHLEIGAGLENRRLTKCM